MTTALTAVQLLFTGLRNHDCFYSNGSLTETCTADALLIKKADETTFTFSQKRDDYVTPMEGVHQKVVKL